MQLKKQQKVTKLFERLGQLIVRLKEVLLCVEERQNEAHGNEAEIENLYSELVILKKDHVAAMKALDELEEVIKKWE